MRVVDLELTPQSLLMPRNLIDCEKERVPLLFRARVSDPFRA